MDAQVHRRRSAHGDNARDDQAREFERLYEQSYALVYNYVRRRMLGDSAAEDVVSEAFLQAAAHFDQFDPSRAKFSSWVIGIAIKRMQDCWRKERPAESLDDVPEGLLVQPDDQDSVADADLVDRMLAVLSETERELVLMKYGEEYPNVEIAAKLGMNVSTVSTKLANARAKMRAVAEGGR